MQGNYICPGCFSDTDVIPIEYGEPMDEAIELAKEGKIWLGGCVLDLDSPTHVCKKCELKFGMKGQIEPMDHFELGRLVS